MGNAMDFDAALEGIIARKGPAAARPDFSPSTQVLELRKLPLSFRLQRQFGSAGIVPRISEARLKRRLRGWACKTRTQKCRRKFPFGRSHRFAGIQPNSGHRDYSRLSCDLGETQLGPKDLSQACLRVRWQELPRFSADPEMIRRRPFEQHHCSICAGLFPPRERLWWSRTASLTGLLLSPASAP